MASAYPSRVWAGRYAWAPRWPMTRGLFSRRPSVSAARAPEVGVVIIMAAMARSAVLTIRMDHSAPRGAGEPAGRELGRTTRGCWQAKFPAGLAPVKSARPRDVRRVTSEPAALQEAAEPGPDVVVVRALLDRLLERARLMLV